MEAADKNSKELQDPRTARSDVLQVSTRPKKQCYRCGRNHDQKDCKFREAKCHKCGKQGHIAPVCRSTTGQSTPSTDSGHQTKRKFKPRNRKRSPEAAKWVEVDDISASVFSVADTSASKPITVNMDINGRKVEMELDTGATVSIMSKTTFEGLFPGREIPQSTLELKTYTGEPMRVLGEFPVKVVYNRQPLKELTLVIIEGDGPTLLGRNWLHHIRLDWSSIKAVLPHQRSLTDLMEKHHGVFTDELGTIKNHKAKLSVAQSATPKFHRPRSVPFAMKNAVEDELDRLENIGVLEKVTFSEWAAPIVCVLKKDGRVRICGDYKVTINAVLEVDQYPLPRPDDLFATLAGGRQFTTLDLSHAYNQLVLDEESRPYLTINTHRGLYRYTRLPFGVASAPAVFQKTMDTILQGMKGVICYIDDILITGSTEAEHLENLEHVLQRFRQHGIRVKRNKCYFMQSSVQYLGHRIDAEGIHATDSKLKAITEAPAPKNIQELRSFLGLLNYYGRFIPNLSSILHPLNELLCQDTQWKWSDACKRAFKLAKEKVVSPNVLVHYDPTLSISLAGDASAYGVGAVISHIMRDGSERPIAFASRTLLASERNYAQVEKEALSLIFGVKRFHTYLYGRQFTLVTDHKPLTTILGPQKGVPAMAAARLQRWAVCLSAYSYDIQFRPTSKHQNADGLSRLPLHAINAEGSVSDPSIFNTRQLESLPVTAVQIASATRTDPILSQVFTYAQKGWPSRASDQFHPFFIRKKELTVESGCILWGVRVIIPEKYRQNLLSELHRDHPGIRKMKAVARSYFWWPGLDKNIEELAKSCVECQAVKNSPQVAPLHPWVWPARPWQRVHIDFAGPFQGAMFLVAVDAHSKWPEVSVMSTTTVPKTIEALRQMFSKYGLPDQIVSDNGPQFTSTEFEIFMKRNGIKHTRNAPYHPSTNGLAERFVQSLKQGLKVSLSTGTSLTQRLCNFLLTYRSSPHSTTGVSPCSLFLKREVRTRFEILKPNQESRVMDKQSQQKSDHDKRSRHRQFFLGQSVMAKNLRPGPKWVPAVVVERLGPLSYLVETSEHECWRRHVDMLKECTIHDESTSTKQSEADYGGATPGVPVEDSEGVASDIVTETPTSGVELSTEQEGGNSEEGQAGETQAGETNSTTSSSSGITESVPTRSYPNRVHNPPDYYKPGS